jgi:hypothetical protein
MLPPMNPTTLAPSIVTRDPALAADRGARDASPLAITPLDAEPIGPADPFAADAFVSPRALPEMAPPSAASSRPPLNIHSAIDDVATMLGGLMVGRNPYFSKSIDSPTLLAHVAAIKVEVPPIEGCGEVDVVADTLVGKLSAAFFVAQWKGSDYPTIIYHPGTREKAFDFGPFATNSFKGILLDSKPPIEANLIVVRAPFHELSSRAYQQKVAELSNYAAMVATSTALIEALVSSLKAGGSRRVLVSGLSIGGFITNLHRAQYNSADCYVPLLAGARLGELFSEGDFRRLTGALGKSHPERLHEVLDFEEAYKKVSTDNVRPLLGRFDGLIEYESQRHCYGNTSIRVLDRGHVAGPAAPLREHLLRALNEP